MHSHQCRKQNTVACERIPVAEVNDVANKRILDLVNPDYMKRIPFFVRSHATSKTYGMIAREFSEIYEVFSKQEEPSEDEKSQMSLIVNDIFKERMAKHNL